MPASPSRRCCSGGLDPLESARGPSRVHGRPPKPSPSLGAKRFCLGFIEASAEFAEFTARTRQAEDLQPYCILLQYQEGRLLRPVALQAADEAAWRVGMPSVGLSGRLSGFEGSSISMPRTNILTWCQYV